MDPYTNCACPKSCGVCDDTAHCPDHCKSKPLDTRDKKLLDKLSNVFEFSHNAAEEKRLYSLFRRGMVERRNEIYRQKPKNIEYRWAYRLKEI